MQNVKNVQQAVDYIQSKSVDDYQSKTGIVYGTGYGGLETQLKSSFCIRYAEIPGFPDTTVSGHDGKLYGGLLGDIPVWLLSGRAHLYEGYTSADVCMGVRTLAGLGIERLILTNAAGALNPQFEVGAVMCITDQINLTGASPLTDALPGTESKRFVDMSEAYSPELLDLVRTLAVALQLPLERGVYAGVRGPQYETPAETRMLRLLGADAVGMSTVLETIAARQAGLEVLGLSCLTNKNLPDCMEPVTHEEVVETVKSASWQLNQLITELVQVL